MILVVIGKQIRGFQIVVPEQQSSVASIPKEVKEELVDV